MHVCHSNGNSVGSAVFAGNTVVTNTQRQTDNMARNVGTAASMLCLNCRLKIG